MQLTVFAVVVALAMVAHAQEMGNSSNYQCTCKSNVCTNIPADKQYYLTSFCDQTTACGKSCGNCEWAYSTSAMRFGCNAQLKCCLNSNPSKCTTLQVIDSGPACWVENNAGLPIIDASYSTCSYFTGSKSCGYTDHVKITCSKISDNVHVPLHELGPCATTKVQAYTEMLPLCPQ